MTRSANVAELLKRGDGRHSVGDSLYLVVRGGSALWEYRYRHERRLRSQWLGSAVGLAPMTLTQARAARAASWLERRGTAPTRTARAQLRKQRQQSNLRFTEAAANFFDRQSDTWCKTEGERVRGLLKNYAAPLNDKPINRITVDDVAAVLKP